MIQGRFDEEKNQLIFEIGLVADDGEVQKTTNLSRRESQTKS
jgi:hypothetical protein